MKNGFLRFLKGALFVKRSVLFIALICAVVAIGVLVFNNNASDRNYLKFTSSVIAVADDNNFVDESFGEEDEGYIIEVSKEPKSGFPTYMYWVIGTVIFVAGSLAISIVVRYFIAKKKAVKKPWERTD
jgi:hypothetical protein